MPASALSLNAEVNTELSGVPFMHELDSSYGNLPEMDAPGIILIDM